MPDPDAPAPSTTSRAAARLAVMLSGSGRTLLNLLDAIADGRLHATIPLVIASRECLGAERARSRGITTVVIPGTIGRERLTDLLTEHQIDLVALAGYLRLVEVPVSYRGRIVNIHPALLPDFGGKNMYGDRVHAAVLAAGVPTTGCTVHLVDDRYDTGPIIAQASVPVLPGDDAHTIAARVFDAECRLYPQALQQLIAGRVPT